MRAILIALFLFSSCSYFSKGKYFTEDDTNFGEWQLIKIQKSHSDMAQKDKLIFKNGIEVGNFAYQVQKIDAMKAHDQVVYFVQGSPCQNCDQLKSLFLVNPYRGGAKLAFLPGRYFAGDLLEFHGRLFYGDCLPTQTKNLNHQVYLHRSTVQSPEKPDNRVKKLIMIQPFENSYPSQEISLNLFSEILRSSKRPTQKCFEMAQKDFVIAE